MSILFILSLQHFIIRQFNEYKMYEICYSIPDNRKKVFTHLNKLSKVFYYFLMI